MMYTCGGRGKRYGRIAGKLQIKAGASVLVGNAPEGFALELPESARTVDRAEQADVVLVFVRDSSEVRGSTRRPSWRRRGAMPSRT